jgi:RND family efflux transporter MFP subunit
MTMRILRPRPLMAAGTIALLIACAIVANGIIQRANSAQEVARWTDQQTVPTVTLAKLAPGQAQTVTLPGTIQAYYKAAIYARVSGYLKSWQQDIGAHVTAGQVLATIDAPDLDQQLAQAKADLATAAANAQLAAVSAQRSNALLRSQWVSAQTADNNNANASATKATMDAAAANVKRLEAMEKFKSIVAPFDGIVTARNTDIGALITAGNAGQELFEVSDLHKVRIYVQVPQAFSAQIQPGMKANFEMPQYPGQQFQATVVTSSNAMNARSRSMLVELQADNAEGKLLAGAYCQVHFQLPGDPNTVLAPATAIIPSDTGTQVALLGRDGNVVLKPIQIGRDVGDRVEVVAGLSPSDRVIDSPPQTLQPGDPVQLAAASPLTKQMAAVPSRAKAN